MILCTTRHASMPFIYFSAIAAVLLSLLYPPVCSAQSFQRLGTCPDLGCIFPPDQADFLAGQYFDIRLEVHAPQNGSEGTPGKSPDPDFRLTLEKVGAGSGGPKPVTEFFGISDPPLERWTFKWFEDFFAKDANTPSVVNVTSKAYRRVQLNEPGEYTVKLYYDGGKVTTASWLVRSLDEAAKAKNIVFFIGDGELRAESLQVVMR